MRKYLFVLFFAAILILTASVAAEDYDNVLNLMDSFYVNGTDPWSLKKSDLPNLENLKGFVCRSILTAENDHVMTCGSVKGAYKGNYQITASFGADNNLVLDAVELYISHPTLTAAYDKYGNIDHYLRTLTDIIKEKEYVKPTLYETSMVNTPSVLHMIMAKNAKYFDVFRFTGTAVSIGSVNDKIVVNFASNLYYLTNCYITKTDEATGETIYISIYPE